MTSFTSCRDGYSSKPFWFRNCISCEFCQNFNFILSFYKHSCKGLLGQNKNRTLTTFRAVLVSSVRSPEKKLLFFLRRTAFFSSGDCPLLSHTNQIEIWKKIHKPTNIKSTGASKAHKSTLINFYLKKVPPEKLKVSFSRLRICWKKSKAVLPHLGSTIQVKKSKAHPWGHSWQFSGPVAGSASLLLLLLYFCYTASFYFCYTACVDFYFCILSSLLLFYFHHSACPQHPTMPSLFSDHSYSLYSALQLLH